MGLSWLSWSFYSASVQSLQLQGTSLASNSTIMFCYKIPSLCTLQWEQLYKSPRMFARKEKLLNWVLFGKTKQNKTSLLTQKSFQFSSVQFSHSVVSNCLWPHESQHTRPPCPSPTPGVHSDSRPSSQWCHPAISSSVITFSSCP